MKKFLFAAMVASLFVGNGGVFAEDKKITDTNADAYLKIKESAKAGDAKAQMAFGVFCQISITSVCEGGAVEAIKWYKLSAAQGNADGQKLLAAAYSVGMGVPKDDVISYMWINIAISSISSEDFKSISEWRDRLAEHMTPQQIAEAQKMSRECVARKLKDC